MSTEKNPHDQQCLVCRDWYTPGAAEERVCLCSFCRKNLHIIIQREQQLLSNWGAHLGEMIETLSDEDHTRYSRIYHALHSTPAAEQQSLQRKIENTKRKGDAVSAVLIQKAEITKKQTGLYTLLQLQEMLS